MRILLLLFLALDGCATDANCPVAEIGAAIDDELQKGAAATAAEDIDAYMDGVPADYRIVEDDGSITDREALRRYALESWTVIDKTISLEVTLDALEVAPSCNEADATTSQRWERLMRRPDGSGPDSVVTTQKHKEKWRRTGERWYNYEIVELGGEVFINGVPYKPEG